MGNHKGPSPRQCNSALNLAILVAGTHCSNTVQSLEAQEHFNTFHIGNAASILLKTFLWNLSRNDMQ